MFFNENQIARAEFTAFEAACNQRPALEGITVKVPNVIDRALTALRNIRSRQQPRSWRGIPCGYARDIDVRKGFCWSNIGGY
jgi:hypothetical protein